jgi:hypothetical protein
LTKEAEFKSKHNRVVELDEAGGKILESLRFQDQDQSTKSGALLAFSGLLIATSIVQLSVGTDSPIHLPDQSFWFYLCALGVAAHFVAASFALANLITTKSEYSSGVYEAMEEFEGLVSNRRGYLSCALWFSVGGTALSFLALTYSVLCR